MVAAVAAAGALFGFAVSGSAGSMQASRGRLRAAEGGTRVREGSPAGAAREARSPRRAAPLCAGRAVVRGGEPFPAPLLSQRAAGARSRVGRLLPRVRPPFNSYGPASYALHVADGSEIVTRSVEGPSLTVRVGRYGRERYGSCLARLAPAKLADGYLPILQTRTSRGRRRATGRSRSPGASAAPPRSVSFVRLGVDARASGRTQPSASFLRRGRSVRRRTAWLRRGDAADLSAGGAYDGHAFRYTVPAGETSVVYALWLNRPARGAELDAGAATYDDARGS